MKKYLLVMSALAISFGAVAKLPAPSEEAKAKASAEVDIATFLNIKFTIKYDRSNSARFRQADKSPALGY